MKVRKHLRRLATAGAVMAGMGIAPTASALYVGEYAISDFVPESVGGCGGDDRSAWPGMAQAWWDEMGARGHYRGPSDSRYRYVDGNMTVKRFCDPDSHDADCRDYQSSWPAGVDWMDASIVATHGWDDGDHWGGLMRYPWKGECGLRVGGSSAQVRLGDSWTMFIIGSSCQSADDDNLPGIRVAMQDSASSSLRRAHQFDGFHGIMWISSSYNGNYRETAADGHVVSIGYAWVTNHFKNNSQACAAYDPFNWFGTCQDQCPIAYAVGPTASSALTRLVTERYNNTYADPGSTAFYQYYYYENCNPVGETAFVPQ